MAPPLLTAFFVAQVLGVAALLPAALYAAAGLRAALVAAAGVALFLGATFALAASGALMAFEPFPPPLMRLFALVTLGTLALALSPVGRWLTDGVPLVWLLGFQAFRIPVEIFLDLGYRTGVFPIQMTFEGLNFDILTGASALVMAWLVARGGMTRTSLKIWNVGGLALLVNIVTIAVLSFPTPWRLFTNEPANFLVAHAPFVWLPLVLVQAALLGHLLVFRWLVRHPEALKTPHP